MISLLYSFKTKPGMNLEFLQTAGSIIVDMHKVKGCVHIDFQQDSKDKDQFYFRLDWQSNQLLKAMLASKEYGILEGAMKVLCHEPLVEITGVETKKIKIEENSPERNNIYERIKLEFIDD
jgi:quinol monooxygenase YgiN